MESLTWPDAITAAFEIAGSVPIWLNVKQILKDKCFRGVSLPYVGFFALWGLWNLYYYPHLSQWLAFIGGISIVSANLVWLALMYKYRKN